MKILVLSLALVLAPASAFAANVTIIQKGRAFQPREVTLKKGDTLTFTNNDEFIHQMYSTDLFDSDEKSPGQTLTEDFSRDGTFEVHCHIHPKMKLIVHVN
jgi:plastocyanin